MSRPRGARSAGFDERRAELLRKLQSRLVARADGWPSLRELAASTEVSVATLRHYFGGRELVIEAVLRQFAAEGTPHLAHMAEPQGDFAASVAEAIFYFGAGFKFGLGDLHGIGFSEGMNHPRLGPLFVELVLEPSLEAIAARLARHVERGEASIPDLRTAALQLAAPVVLAALHQSELGGATDFPLATEAFYVQHAETLVRAYGVDRAKQPVAPSSSSSS